MKRFAIILFVFTISFFLPHIFAYNDTKTHPHLTEDAIEHSNLDVYLQNDLGLEKSLDPKRPGTFLEEKYVTELIQEGSHLEDVPACRASNHFHNPWELWKDAMLTDPPRNGGSSHHA
ncbi:MAG: hypothetical protein D3910_13480 [Candidatus Electrothrix sp. ATG2]|nr:hypothetical protein [Candidatus Electrothrix sp. ATG2]